MNSQSIEPKIAGLAKNAAITDVACSVDTNVIYLLITNNGVGTIYRTDANNKVSQVSNAPRLVGRIAVLSNKDGLLCDSIATGRVYLMDSGGKQWLSPHDDNKYALIGADKDDNIYIARLNTPQDTDTRMADAIFISRKYKAFTLLQQMDSCPVSSIKVNYDGALTHN